MMTDVRPNIAVRDKYKGELPDRAILDLLEKPPMRERIRTALAQYAHDDAWSGWMRYLLSKCTHNDDGSATIPAWAVERWQRQITTPFTDLPESERASDYDEADAMLAAIAHALASNTPHQETTP
jgi:hypothetical protein